MNDLRTVLTGQVVVDDVEPAVLDSAAMADTEEGLNDWGLTEEDLASFTAGSLVVDVSCDAGMGFEWARPTSFAEPTIQLANDVLYYAVDHSPSYLWNSATWEISEALLPHLETVLAGPAAWDETPTIARAIEIRDGTVRNPAILAFQHREQGYPHRRSSDR